MSRIDDVLQMNNLVEGAKEEIKNADQATKDLEHLAHLAQSPEGDTLTEMLREGCRDALFQMLTAKSQGEEEKIMPLLADFEAKFTLYNTIKSAPQDYSDAREALEERLDEILQE